MVRPARCLVLPFHTGLQGFLSKQEVAKELWSFCASKGPLMDEFLPSELEQTSLLWGLSYPKVSGTCSITQRARQRIHSKTKPPRTQTLTTHALAQQPGLTGTHDARPLLSAVMCKTVYVHDYAILSTITFHYMIAQLCELLYIAVASSAFPLTDAIP